MPEKATHLGLDITAVRSQRSSSRSAVHKALIFTQWKIPERLIIGPFFVSFDAMRYLKYGEIQLVITDCSEIVHISRIEYSCFRKRGMKYEKI